MTDQEILAGWFSIQELAMTAMMFYLSIVTGFLVAAYIAGKNFTRSQSIFVSSLFAIFSLFALWGSVGYFYLGAEYAALYDVSFVIQSRPLGIKPYYVIGLLEFVGIIAALKFMWDVRHSESE